MLFALYNYDETTQSLLVVSPFWSTAIVFGRNKFNFIIVGKYQLNRSCQLTEFGSVPSSWKTDVESLKVSSQDRLQAPFARVILTSLLVIELGIAFSALIALIFLALFADLFIDDCCIWHCTWSVPSKRSQQLIVSIFSIRWKRVHAHRRCIIAVFDNVFKQAGRKQRPGA